MGNTIKSRKSRISNQTKFRQSVRRFFGDFLVGTSNDLTRSRPCYEGSKSEIRGVVEGMGGSKSSCRGGKKIALPYCQRTLELQMNGRA
ncbi:hypothetical protein AVEN_50925-1 [Araneus ventricosus]|uniref:Uncharacterized protein n=1 Tax=Araneus ventricosus TaxID=182803 RepID=A0A4Y2SHJ0_ARAVE|nr:hypothetical protein AVEN_50925-1 [Araneus ventricosus]